MKKEITYQSSDGKNNIFACLFLPESGQIKGVVQLAHGMTDYVDRYASLAEYLCSRGFILAGNEHLGHGRTAASGEDLGYFAERDGYLYVIEDMKKMNEYLHSEYPQLPLVILGHSMGSFLTRLYVAKYPESVDAVIIHGTGGKNPAAPFGRILVSILKAVLGSRHRSGFITAVAFGSYNSRFDKSEGKEAWLTRDIAKISDRATNPYTSFIFTLSGYHDLFTMLIECNSKKWYRDYPKDKPTLVMSGEEDPVGNYGKGVMEVYEGLKASGVKDLNIKLYPGARHELFKEYNFEDVFSDIYQWICTVAK